MTKPIHSRRLLPKRILSALLWLAAFCFATGIFLAATQLLRGLPPTAPVAVGRVTIEKVSKAHDYAAALLFFLLVPAATVWLHRAGTRENDRLRGKVDWHRDAEGIANLVSLLFVAPFFLAPFLYLTTFKPGWPLLIPLALSQLAPRVVIALHGTRWLRALFARDLVPFHTLIAVEALAWILFRYVGIGRRIAHVPTLFLEIVFVAFVVALFWAAFVLIARLATFTTGLSAEVALQRLAVAGLPLTILPLFPIRFVSAGPAISIVMPLVLLAIVLALRHDAPVDPRAIRNLTAFVILPVLLYVVSYASTASLSQWIDLFHRGESLGPASDYLRGKVPYRDVFVLHGLMEDGQLDAWIFQLFGRHVELALARPVILGSFAVPALWFLGMAIFDSIPLAMLVILLGAVTTVDNERIFFEIAVLALLFTGYQRRRDFLVVLAGLMAAVTIFFSYDIGMYAIGGSLLFLAILRRWRSIFAFLAGFVLGAAPFLVYLGMRGALGAFVETSFVTLPRIIDAVWSLPFPDLTTTFRKDLNLRAISDFFLSEAFRFVLNPLVIGVALVVLVQRALAKTFDRLDVALLALTTFALLTQRSALGRADFPHQYFSAFLVGPMILVLLVRFARAAATIWRTRDRGAQAFLLAVVVAVLPLFAVALWVPDIMNGRLDDAVHYQGRVSRIGFVDPAAEEIRQRVDGIRYHVFDLSKKGEPIFDFSNQPALYFFTDRPNPTRFYQVPILSPRDFQRETIVALERAKPPLVIRRSPQRFDVFDEIDNTVRAQAVAAYLDENYAYARSVRGVEIWQRKPRATARFDVDSYLRRIRVPTLKELHAVGARSRLVFPTIGSLPGATGNYWRSDLVLHNPFKEWMPLELRYVAGDTRIDRRVQLGAGQTIRWEDVVKTLFAAPDSRGVLTIDYRGVHGPVARVKTYDAAHAASASLESPLSLRDSATAGADNSDLTIVGIPANNGRRVNIGVVNVGEIPATFRFTAHTRGGARIGKAVEEGLPEDESLLVQDAEKALGVPLDESVTVHVSMVAGTGIAYATVVSSEGDNQFIAAVPSPKP